jgi:hypothetical protein
MPVQVIGQFGLLVGANINSYLSGQLAEVQTRQYAQQSASGYIPLPVGHLPIPVSSLLLGGLEQGIKPGYIGGEIGQKETKYGYFIGPCGHHCRLPDWVCEGRTGNTRNCHNFSH